MNMHSYYMGMSNITGGLDADIGDAFWDRDEHTRRIGELARILPDAGLIFITAINDADEYDLDKLKMLNSPNELLVVNIGDSILGDYEADINLRADPDMGASLNSILKLLSERHVIPEYCI